MKYPTALACMASLLLGSTAFAATAQVKPAIFAAKLTCYDITLNGSDGNSIMYTAVTESIDKKGKVHGAATRYDTVSQMSVPVTISGGIKGKPKVVKKGGKTYASVKGTIVFSDGTTGTALFTSRNLPKSTKSKPDIFDNDLTEINAILTAILGAITYSGTSFSYKATK